MSHQRKNFIPINEGFTCEACGFVTPPASGTCRNHCPRCLTSKHVDANVPGDRLSACGGLMPAIDFEGVDPDKLDLVQKCQKCGKIGRNKVAPDDDKEVIFSLR